MSLYQCIGKMTVAWVTTGPIQKYLSKCGILVFDDGLDEGERRITGKNQGKHLNFNFSN